MNCVMTINNNGEQLDTEHVKKKIQSLADDYFLIDKEMTLKDFTRISKEDSDMKGSFEAVGIFEKGKYADDFIEGLEEELNRMDDNHSDIDPEKYQKIRQGVDFKEPKEQGMFSEQETELGDQFMAVKPYLGAVKNSAPSNSREFKGNLDPPEMDIQLKYVHGYRTFDTRNNIHFVDENHIMFHAAGVNIKMKVEANSKNSQKHAFTQSFNVENSDDITAMAFNYHTKLAAFGQIGHKPIINIVNSRNMETESILVGDLQKGIGHLAFNQEGNMLVATAMNSEHDIAIYDLSNLTVNKRSQSGGKCKLICKSRGTKDNVLALKFSQSSTDNNIYMATRRDVYYVNLNKGQIKMKKVSGYKKGQKQSNICIGFLKGFDLVVGTNTGALQGIKGQSLSKSENGHSKIVYAIWSSADGRMLISGGGDGRVIIWGSQLKLLKTFKINQNFPLVDPRVRALTLSPDQNYLVIGTRGGQIVKMGFGETRKSAQVFKEVILNSHHSNELWGLVCHSSKAEYITCGEDFIVARWGLKEKKLLARGRIKYQAKVVAIHEKSNRIAVGCKNGRVLILDYLSLELIKEIRVCTKEISELKYSPPCLNYLNQRGSEYLAVGAHNGKIYIYDAQKNYAKKAVLKGHHSTITHVDFGLDGSFLQSNCTSYELLYFDMNNFKQNTRGASGYKDEVWASWTCTFGWWVQGIYPPCSDGTDVNSIDRSHDGRYLITGDDFGTVKIFNNPALKKAAYKKYLGHSSHVTNVRFSQNDQYIISVGN